MTACKLTAYLVTPENQSWEQASTRTVCETHGWRFHDNPVSGSAPDVAVACPLGRIEQATEEALRKIEKALEGKG
jgi:hypothetical protein